MLFFAKGSESAILDDSEIKESLYSSFEKLSAKKKVLAIPPDFTRVHSYAGKITYHIYKYFGNNLVDILPALGTHRPMTRKEIETMFNGIPQNLFRVHNWRKDLLTLGRVPGVYIKELSENKVDYDWPAQVNKLVAEAKHDLILSIGQVVPHEVIGMANHNKNIFIGTGGQEGINRSHFLGAVYGMERIMGRVDTPVRRVINYASDNFAEGLPIVYVLTVIGREENGKLVVRGLYIGDDYECFKLAADLSLKINFQMLDQPLKKVLVYLDPTEFKSTWLGNKSIYRTRMAIADGGELIILAPGVEEFGEDREIDLLIRKYGYLTTPEILKSVEKNNDLRNNLSAAAHLIHGSSEGRFRITYCTSKITKEEIESVNYHYADLRTVLKKYDPQKLKDGFNLLTGGEELFFISNPSLGLWADKQIFKKRK